MDLGPVVQKSRDMLVCLGGSLESQLAARVGKWCRARAARWDLPIKLPMKFSPERPHNRTSPECTPRVEKLSALRSRRIL